MIAGNTPPELLEEVLGFAAAYRGWTARQLGVALDRDPSNLVPDSGVPKLDLMIRLAETLDWQVADLVELLGDELGLVAGSERAGSDCDGTDRDRKNRPVDAGRSGVHMSSGNPSQARRGGSPATPADRKPPIAAGCPSIGGHQAALLRRADTLVVRGRHRQAIELLQRALLDLRGDDSHRPDAARPRRADLLLRLARAYHHAGDLVEGRALAGEALTALEWMAIPEASALRTRALVLRAARARELIEAIRADAAAPVVGAHAIGGLADLRDPSVQGTLHGGCHGLESAHRLAGRPIVDECAVLARASLEDLAEASSQLAHPAVADRVTSPAALTHRIGSLRLELEEALDPASGRSTLRALLADLDAVIDVEEFADRELLESHGWSCIGGFGIAARHLCGDTLQQALGILSNKADEIASAVGSWALRERVLVLEYARRQRFAEAGTTQTRGDGTVQDGWLLDREDLRVIVGCIGGSPRFRRIGLDILRHASIVDCEPLDLPRRDRSAKATRARKRGGTTTRQPATSNQ